MVPKLSPGAWLVVGLVVYAAVVGVFWEPIRRPARADPNPPADTGEVNDISWLFDPDRPRGPAADLGITIASRCALLLAAPALIIRYPAEALTLLYDFVFRVPPPGGGCG